MQAWEFLESAPNEGGGCLELMRRGKEMVICVDGRELMGTKAHNSEDALSHIVCDMLEPTYPELNVNILIGGLGIGFTLRAALDRVGPEGSCTVAELSAAVIKWNSGPLGEASNYPVADMRTKVHNGDVAELIKEPPRPWDAILLDVDNGPRSLTHKDNDWLYTPNGLKAAHAALKPGGILAVWSAHDDPKFTLRMERAGYITKIQMVRSRGKKGGNRHYIWTGIK